MSDTHLRRSGSERLPRAALAQLERADHVLHAGDVVDDSVLDELARYAPLTAVLGNNDAALVGSLPETVELELGGVTVAMLHDSGPKTGREGRLARRFPDAAIVVFGHSHLPVDVPGLAGQRLLNPGSPTAKRRAPTHTLATVDLADGRIERIALVDVDRP